MKKLYLENILHCAALVDPNTATNSYYDALEGNEGVEDLKVRLEDLELKRSNLLLERQFQKKKQLRELMEIGQAVERRQLEKWKHEEQVKKQMKIRLAASAESQALRDQILLDAKQAWQSYEEKPPPPISFESYSKNEIEAMGLEKRLEIERSVQRYKAWNFNGIGYLNSNTFSAVQSVLTEKYDKKTITETYGTFLHTQFQKQVLFFQEVFSLLMQKINSEEFTWQNRDIETVRLELAQTFGETQLADYTVNISLLFKYFRSAFPQCEAYVLVDRTDEGGGLDWEPCFVAVIPPNVRVFKRAEKFDGDGDNNIKDSFPDFPHKDIRGIHLPLLGFSLSQFKGEVVVEKMEKYDGEIHISFGNISETMTNSNAYHGFRVKETLEQHWKNGLKVAFKLIEGWSI
eukprot:g5008.t1